MITRKGGGGGGEAIVASDTGKIPFKVVHAGVERSCVPENEKKMKNEK